jgi:hypothetical protein
MEDIGLFEAIIGALATGAIYPLVVLRRKLRAIMRALDFQDQSTN